MKKKFVWLILAILLIAVLAGAAVLYPRLAAKNTPVTPVSTTEPATAETTNAAASEAAEDVTAEAASADVTDPTSLKKRAGAPDFTVLNEYGEEDMLSFHIGKPVVLNFWATWCGYCVDELPAFDAAAKEYGDKIDFMMIDLADGYRETVIDATEFMEENGFTFPVYFDTTDSASTAFNVFNIPSTVFINADGTIHASYLGNMPEELLLQYIRELIAG